ncbi:hypothetical protein [Rhodococcus sp. RD6.2]|uniref:hypothetical protein n=1 Tax=Rhodococcus sp. RD6.2 TaxID=260936 RepID=UPI000AB16E91|nr:hypothetical protein [Rhodococcus sp. RD6.2]
MRTTPAQITAVGIGLIVIAIVSGAVAAAQVTDRERTLDTLHSEVEPLAHAAQDIYSSLSIADAAATTAFLAGGIEPAEVRDRYTLSISDASADLVDAAAGIDESDTTSHDLLARLSVGVPIYTGLIETARVNNRSGQPVGSAYLSEASSMMQSTLLPLAEQLHTVQAARVVQMQAEFATPPWLAIALLMVTFVALVVAQLLLAKWTRRRLNAGLILASVAVAASLAWLVIAGLLSAASTARALDAGARPLAELTTGRIITQQARADETLGLVRRDFSGRYDEQFQQRLTDLDALLEGVARGSLRAGADEVAVADRAQEAWSEAHRRLMTLLDRGDWDGAVSVAVGPAGGSAIQYATADAYLTHAIDETRSELRSGVARAVDTLTGLATGTIALAALAVAGIAAGLWPRLREYQ